MRKTPIETAFENFLNVIGSEEARDLRRFVEEDPRAAKVATRIYDNPAALAKVHKSISQTIGRSKSLRDAAQGVKMDPEDLRKYILHNGRVLGLAVDKDQFKVDTVILVSK